MATVGQLFADLRLNTTRFASDMERSRRIAERNSRQMESAFQKVKRVTETMGLAFGALGVAQVLRNTVNAAISFESAMTGVKKTTELTTTEFAELSTGIRNMAKEIPLSVEGIAKIAESAGQLGIKKENILGFARVMADLGVTTNLTSEQAATALARLANITGMNQTEFDRLGSTIVDLGNNFATTEAEIVEMGLRIAGAGSLVGLTEDQILAFAATLSSVGIEAEAGGTAISRVFVEIEKQVATAGKDLSLFAEVAGMSTQQFSRAFVDNAAGAVAQFINGLGRMQKSGKSTSVILERLGMDNVRISDALKRTAGGGDLLTKALGMGAEAWEDNSALVREAVLRYGTAESKIQLFKNTINDLQIDLGGKLVPVLIKFTDVAGFVIRNTDQFTGALQLLLAAGIGGLLMKIPAAIVAFKSWHASMIAALVASKSLGAAVTALGGPLAIIAGAVLIFRNQIADSVIAMGEWLRLLPNVSQAQADSARETQRLAEMLESRLNIQLEQGAVSSAEFRQSLLRMMDVVGTNREAFEQLHRKLESGKITQAQYELQLKKLINTGKTAADVQNEQVAGGQKLREEQEKLVESFRKSINPSKELADKIRTLMTEFDKDLIVKAFADEIRTAALTQRELGTEIDPLIAKLNDEVLAMELAAVAARDLDEATGALLIRYKIGRDTLPDLNKLNRELAEHMRSAADVIASRTTPAVSDLIMTHEEMNRVLGVETISTIEQTRAEFEEWSRQVEKQNQVSEEWNRAWEHAMGNILSGFIGWTSDMISRGNSFAKQLLNIFLSQLLNPLLEAATSIMGGVANAIFGFLSGKGGGGFSLGNLFGVKDAGKIAAGAAGILGAGGVAMGASMAGAGAAGTLAGMSAPALPLFGAGVPGSAAIGGGAAAGGGLGLFGAMKTAGAFLATNPIGWAIMAGLGGLAFGGKIGDALTVNTFEKGSKEFSKDFAGLQIGEDSIKNFVSSLGISEDLFTQERKLFLGSPKALQDLILPIAEQTGQMDKVIQAFSQFEAFGEIHNFSDALKEAIETGNFQRFNEEFLQMAEQSERIGHMLPGLADKFTAVSVEVDKAATRSEMLKAALDDLRAAPERAAQAMTQLAEDISILSEQGASNIETWKLMGPQIQQAIQLHQDLGVEVPESVKNFIQQSEAATLAKFGMLEYAESIGFAVPEVERLALATDALAMSLGFAGDAALDAFGSGFSKMMSSIPDLHNSLSGLSGELMGFWETMEENGVPALQAQHRAWQLFGNRILDTFNNFSLLGEDIPPFLQMMIDWAVQQGLLTVTIDSTTGSMVAQRSEIDKMADSAKMARDAMKELADAERGLAVGNQAAQQARTVRQTLSGFSQGFNFEGFAAGPAGLSSTAQRLGLTRTQFNDLLGQSVIDFGAKQTALANFLLSEGMGSGLADALQMVSPFVGSFATGTDFVPRTGLALVHRGEQIIPAAIAGRGEITVNVGGVHVHGSLIHENEVNRRVELAVRESIRKGGFADLIH